SHVPDLRHLRPADPDHPEGAPLTECVTCQRPVDGTAYACQGCADRTAEWLTAAADVVADAHDAAAGLVRYGSRGPRGHGDEAPMLGNPAAAARLAAAGNTITTWARHVAEERGQELPEPDRRPVLGPGCAAGWCRHGSCRAIRTRATEHP